MKRFLALTALLLAPLPAVQAAGATVVLAEKGKSEHVITLAPDAAATTVLAARELQRVVKAATNVQLEIATTRTAAPAICLISDRALPHDEFVIRIEGRNIIISGNNAERGGENDPWFIPSHGTLWGVQEFLERFVGVRWLFPGELGEDVPGVSSLKVSMDGSIRGHPSFDVRSLGDVGESDKGASTRPKSAVLEWMKRHRLTNALQPLDPGYGHSWDDYIKPADMEAHPEWKSTSGEPVRNGKVQFFCTTAPGLVETFAGRVIESLDRNPARRMASISPTDGGGFCRCERCAKLITTDPHGRPNHALALLTFYKQVAEIVQNKRPGHSVGGYVYYSYQYPPPQAPALPDNLSLCWAPLNYYGYGLLKPVYRDEFAATMDRWSRISPHLFYRNNSTWMRSFHGAPLPVSLDILKLELPTASKHHVWGARMIGTSAWGVNAPINYLLAKQMWNAQVDVSATLDEWLQRAYGPGWPHMRQLYDELDARMMRHKEQQSPVYKGSQYEVNEEVMKAIYAPLFPTMERWYQQTLAECASEPQRKRLAMFGDNLIQLHFALRKAGLIADDAKSIFHRDDTAFAKFMAGMEAGFSLYWDNQGMDKGPIWKGEWRGP